MSLCMRRSAKEPAVLHVWMQEVKLLHVQPVLSAVKGSPVRRWTRGNQSELVGPNSINSGEAWRSYRETLRPSFWNQLQYKIQDEDCCSAKASAGERTDLAELHLQAVGVAATVEQRFLKSFNDPSFDVVVRSWWQLEVKQRRSGCQCSVFTLQYNAC